MNQGLANSSKKKRSWKSISFQLVVSSVIGIVFVLYVWLIQLNYEKVLLAQNGKHDWHTATLFGLVIFTGSFSYDCAKKIIMLDPDTFSVFWKLLKEGIFSAGLMYVFFFAGAGLFKYDFPVMGIILSVFALAFEFSAISNFSKALEQAAK